MELVDEAQPKILLADDSKMIRATARKMLGDQFDLILAESGEQAWAAITSDPTIMAVFTDVTMPGLDGYGLLQRIREDERGGINELPVIIVTGDQESGAREEALDSGATDFITKPFDRSELVARASAYATRDRMRRHAKVLEESQTQDTVTGLGNGRYFGMRLKSARAYSTRHGLPMALIQIDLVGFDAVVRRNDTDTAKRLLREVGQVLAHRVREEDVLARVGKARFGALCPNCDAEGAERLAQRLVDGVREAHFVGDAVTVGAAAGVHVPAADAETGLQQIYEASQTAADQASARGDGSVVVEPSTAEAPAAEAAEAEAEVPETQASAEAAAPAPSISLDEAVEIAASADGAERLAAEMPQLLERCAQLFEAASPEVARPVLERLRQRIDGQ